MAYFPSKKNGKLKPIVSEQNGFYLSIASIKIRF